MKTYLELLEESSKEIVKGHSASWRRGQWSFLVDKLHEEWSERCIVELEHHCDNGFDERIVELLDRVLVELFACLRLSRLSQAENLQQKTEQRRASFDELSFALAVDSGAEKLQVFQRCLLGC